ncbi:type II restriction enzyme [Anaerococcus sp. Marseille-Q5996]|uniref:type II restriction enzyme n=1 Tax=Anaerococcus sp. Marseille-Q5996 TaxID=2972769 RepID=UPI0021C5CCE8|nr:type II restriction endonuclease [Anaerococcus sp. Marseille-Q5996]
MSTNKSNNAWIKLIEKYNIIDQIDNYGSFIITSKKINEFRESRLMSKWDTYESLPQVFKNEKINILPISRQAYVLGRFDLYKELPEFGVRKSEIKTVNVPQYETIDLDKINSESNALNIMLISNILADFLNEENPVETFNGRMGTENFDFLVNQYRSKNKASVNVSKAQIEIDSGLETKESVTIIEAKNVINANMNIRQLYYPYRLWENKVNKPIRNIFSIYSNKIYKLIEYEFIDKKDFSSIKLLKESEYSIDETLITLRDLKDIHKTTKPIYDEDKDRNGFPSLQANSVDKLISLMELLSEYPKTKDEIADKMEFDIRQADYYFNAGRYLNVMENIYEDGEILRSLNDNGKSILEGSYRYRQLEIVKLIFEHKLFYILFDLSFPNGDISTEVIMQTMSEYGSRENETTRFRRASTIKQWLRWIYSLTE